MDSRVKDLIARGDKLFGDRSTLILQWQMIAENFYPERADFTVTRSLGDEFEADLYDSYPLFIRRELGDFISTLRRKDQEWFVGTIEMEDRIDNAGRQFLEYMTKVQRRAMYDRRSQFTRAAKECDHDYVTFGQGILTIDVNNDERYGSTLLYQNWHLRDVAWQFKRDGGLSEVHRKWTPTYAQLIKQFGKKPDATLHKRITDAAKKDPFALANCRHVVICSDEYPVDRPDPEKKFTYTELYIDIENKQVIYEAPLSNQKYVIPRWKTLSGTQYGLSPAVTVGLPDARLIQAMSFTLLEASEKAVNPPMAAKAEAIQGGVKLFAGGVTAIDAEVDARLEDILAPIYRDVRSLPFAQDVMSSKQQMLAQAFYMNKINLPQFTHEMTLGEFNQRLAEYIRNVIPLFEPVDSDYLGAVCDLTNQVLFENNAFGPRENIPESLRGHETVFKFDNPLSEAIERTKGQTFLETKALVSQAMELDPAAAATVDWRVALRDALTGKRTPAKWMRSERDVEAFAQQQAAQQQAQQQAAMVQQAAETGEQIGLAEQALSNVA